MLFLFFGSFAFGADVVEVEKDDPAPGVGVWMNEAKFKSYVADSRKLSACVEDLGESRSTEAAALDGLLEANRRVVDANKIASAQFGSDAKLINEQVQTIADLGAKLDEERQANARLRQQRNVAWAISGGFLSAATAAVVLTLN